MEALSLTTSLSSKTQRKVALIISLANLAVFALSIPFGRTAGPTVAAFLPAFLTAVFVFDVLTAYLFYNQYRINRRASQLALALTYLYSALIAVPHALTFPGVFSPTGLLHAGSQTAVWLWVFWHAGYPLGILVTLWLEHRRNDPYTEQGAKRRAALGGPAIVLLVTGISLLAICGHDLLPVIIKKDNFTLLITSGVGVVVWVINAAAFACTLFFTRGRSVAQLWLIVAVFAMWLDVTLTLFSGSRYSIGWYVARLNTLLSASIVLLGLIHEITALYVKVARQDQRIKHQAYHDALTNLPNRTLFSERLQSSLQLAAERDEKVAVLFIDLDGFKLINDTYGHDMGDLLLVEVAKRLSSCVRAHDTVARMGGDEFTVILPHTKRLEDAEMVSERILNLLREPIRLQDHHLHISSSIGLSFYPDDGTDTLSLMKNADIAMYKAKESGKNQSFRFQGGTSK
ncbi:sensor domain-containing diguanylate cyclase [Tumebacillus flagellatus]|uniref:GGDEF domain-containing protein n=1 Tax=Tumebacillus flagellatus TaxID=1157490 RepID=A0A074LP53_9BACL|nr:sensor domain-containing diguanylate cyclase [Tumebacillus flagellatus]KEO82280.1 hypothetical protein EL26_15975 [Tumebacillus flagellatus]